MAEIIAKPHDANRAGTPLSREILVKLALLGTSALISLACSVTMMIDFARS